MKSNNNVLLLAHMQGNVVMVRQTVIVIFENNTVSATVGVLMIVRSAK